MNNLVSLGKTDCGLNLQDFVKKTDTSIWYSYETRTVQHALPIQAYEVVDQANDDSFRFNDQPCEYSLTNSAHILPSGIGVAKLINGNKEGGVKWASKISGTIADNACVISISALNGAIGFWPNRENPAIIIPQEQWHAFVSLIFVVLGLVYLMGDMSILRNANFKMYSTYQRLFLLDGPLTALATSTSIVVNEVMSFAESWVVMQQSVLLVGVVVNFTMLVFLLYIDKPEQLNILSMYVEIPIFIAILIPVMHSAGNLFELGCIIATIVTCFVSQRHLAYVKQIESPQATIHKAIAIFNIIVIAPVILLTIVHSEVGSVPLRVLVSLAITLGGLAVASE